MYSYARSNSSWSWCSLYLKSVLRSAFFTSRSPAWVFCQPSKRTYAHDLVDVVDDALDDDRRLVVLALPRTARSGRPCPAPRPRSAELLARLSTTSLARSSSSLRNSTLMSRPCSWRFLRSSSRSARALNRGSCRCLRSRRGDLDLDLLRLLLRVRRAEHGLEQVGVQHQRLEVVPHGIDVHVLVDQLDGLGAQARARAACPVPVDGFTDS